jgi:5-methylcytosine-specific restriction endonuclease McrA
MPKNKEKRNEWEREYYQKNIDKIRARKREYRNYYCREYPDKVKISLKKYYLNNKDSFREKSREYYKSNKETVIEANQRWLEENPEKNREIKSRYRARKNGAKGYIKADEFTDICEKQNWLCVYCGESKPLALEHTQPLSRGGTHEASNIVGSCKNCNSEKHSSTLEEFLDKIGLTMDEFKEYAPHLSYFDD